jgi:hypothetical protein
MGDLTSSYATAGIALRVSGALKPHHHDKVETPSVGQTMKHRRLDTTVHRKTMPYNLVKYDMY